MIGLNPFHRDVVGVRAFYTLLSTEANSSNIHRRSSLSLMVAHPGVKVLSGVVNKFLDGFRTPLHV